MFFICTVTFNQRRTNSTFALRGRRRSAKRKLIACFADISFGFAETFVHCIKFCRCRRRILRKPRKANLQTLAGIAGGTKNRTKMRQAIPFIFLILIGCTNDTLDLDIAKTKAESVIRSIQAENFDTLQNIYSSDFYKKVPSEKWIATLNQVKASCGQIKSYDLIEYHSDENSGDHNESSIVLLYSVRHEQSQSEQRFTIMIEHGEYKVFGHNVKISAL